MKFPVRVLGSGCQEDAVFFLHEIQKIFSPLMRSSCLLLLCIPQPPVLRLFPSDCAHPPIVWLQTRPGNCLWKHLAVAAKQKKFIILASEHMQPPKGRLDGN
eukprot:EG_transcript_60095